MNIKQRLDTFVDAVLAIIITVMVLELPQVESQGAGGIWTLAKGVGIYAVSFCFVAGIWYQHAIAFSSVEKVPKKTVIWDLVLMFVISLVPEATRLMTVVETNYTVMTYGVLYLAVTLIEAEINRQLAHERFTDVDDMRKMYRAIYGDHNSQARFLMIANIILAYFLPRVSMVLWIVITVWSFFANDSDEDALAEISELPATSQKSFVGLTGKDRRVFSQLMKEYGKLMSQNQTDETIKKREDGIRKRLAKYGFTEENIDHWQKHFKERANGQRPDANDPRYARFQGGDFNGPDTHDIDSRAARDVTPEAEREIMGGDGVQDNGQDKRPKAPRQRNDKGQQSDKDKQK